MSGEDLIIELTRERGSGTTRIQPPIRAWEVYFKIDLEDPPSLSLRNQGLRAARSKARPLVRHGHTWSLDISNGRIMQPAILRFHRTGWNRYDYWIYAPNQPEYARCRWMLDSFPNPHHQGGRKWLMI